MDTLLATLIILASSFAAPRCALHSASDAADAVRSNVYPRAEVVSAFGDIRFSETAADKIKKEKKPELCFFCEERSGFSYTKTTKGKQKVVGELFFPDGTNLASVNENTVVGIAFGGFSSKGALGLFQEKDIGTDKGKATFTVNAEDSGGFIQLQTKFNITWDDTSATYTFTRSFVVDDLSKVKLAQLPIYYAKKESTDGVGSNIVTLTFGNIQANFEADFGFQTKYKIDKASGLEVRSGGVVGASPKIKLTK